MSFPRYPAYKPSGVEWLGEVPEHWASRRLGFFFAERREKVSDKDFQALSVTKDGIVPQLDTAAKTDDGDNRKCVRTGDFVINSRSDRKGSSGLSRLDGSVSLICTVLRPQESVQGGFIHHLLRSVSFQEEFYRFGKGIVADLWSTNYSAMSGITLAMPPLEEQESIATFLDHETAKIDALIAEQQRLIELLQEKRQAVISHAVTKGLNPHAPMKDSGVEWLGEIPEHWTGCRFKHCLLGLTDAEHKTCPDYSEGKFMIIRTSNVRDGALIPEVAKYTDVSGYKEWTARCTPKAGDIVFTREAPAGEACIIPEGITACLGQRTVLMHPSSSKVTPEYLVSSIYSGAARTFIQNLSQGSTVSHLNMSEIGNMPLALPPLEEQLHINEYTTDESRKFHELIQQAQTSIKLFQERRSTLISAAVTGQIDVRGYSLETAVA